MGIKYFNPRAPCGARPRGGDYAPSELQFQSTCPLRGTTRSTTSAAADQSISIHVPLAGHDLAAMLSTFAEVGFQSTCPLRGTTAVISPSTPPMLSVFQSTCPLRGTTRYQYSNILQWLFQSTCPLRGTTIRLTARVVRLTFQSTCPLRGTTISFRVKRSERTFQSTCPLRGTTISSMPCEFFVMYFNPRAPCGARRQAEGLDRRNTYFNPRAPCGARRTSKGFSSSRRRFQSTCPLRGTTAKRHKDYCAFL